LVPKDRPRRTPALRLPFLAAGTVCLLLFLGISAWVESARGLPLPFDQPVEDVVLRIAWGPLQPLVDFVAWFNGPRQTVGGILLVVAVSALWPRVGPLMVVGGLSGPIYSLINRVVARPRPPSTGNTFNGFSFPSGHAVFFTVFAVLVAMVLARRLPGVAARWLIGVIAVVWAVAVLSRVWDHAHWPSDVAAGVVLGMAWVTLALSVRWLSAPLLAPAPSA
jgi:membrane-associated phospholipid phosphatase